MLICCEGSFVHLEAHLALAIDDSECAPCIRIFGKTVATHLILLVAMG